MNRTSQDRRIAEIAVVHGELTIYRVPATDPAMFWSFTTCTECATRRAGDLPHAFDVRGLPNPKRLDLESGDATERAASIAQILRHNAGAGTIAPSRCDDRRYMLTFAVPADTPGSYVRALFALYGLPRAAADAFFDDLSLAIRSGRHDLLVSERRALTNALSVAFAVAGCDDGQKAAIEAELLRLLVERSPAA